jgi:hypothetical protein
MTIIAAFRAVRHILRRRELHQDFRRAAEVGGHSPCCTEKFI